MNQHNVVQYLQRTIDNWETYLATTDDIDPDFKKVAEDKIKEHKTKIKKIKIEYPEVFI